MIHGNLYDVTYSIAVNADWTRTETLRFTGTDDIFAVFERPDAERTDKQLKLTIDRIIELAVH